MEPELFFVYGTLQRGYHNNRLLNTSRFICEDITEDKYMLGDVGFPYAFPKHIFEEGFFEEHFYLPVRGEVWEVSDLSVMESIDRLEGEGSHYHRKKINTQTGSGVYIYEQLDPSLLQYCYQCQEREGTWTWK